MLIRRPQDIGALVRSARLAHGLNQQELADRLGVSRWWVNELEGGKATARMDLILRTLNELDIILAAHSSDTPEAQTSASPASVAAIDIDDIADTGLELDSRPRASRSPRRRR